MEKAGEGEGKAGSASLPRFLLRRRREQGDTERFFASLASCVRRRNGVGQTDGQLDGERGREERKGERGWREGMGRKYREGVCSRESVSSSLCVALRWS